jgi:hypothetical protein
MADSDGSAYVGTEFELEWTGLPGRSLPATVQLFNRAEDDDYPLARGNGVDEAGALMDLWITLVAVRQADAAEFVATAYSARTGRRLKKDRAGTLVVSRGA